MNGNVVMKAKDTVFAGLAECFITIGTRRYNFMQAINLEAKFEKNKTEVPILGKTGRGNKASGWKGTGSATFHYNTCRIPMEWQLRKNCCLLWLTIQENTMIWRLLSRNSRASMFPLKIRWKKQKTDRRRGLGSEFCLLCPSEITHFAFRVSCYE